MGRYIKRFVCTLWTKDDWAVFSICAVVSAWSVALLRNTLVLMVLPIWARNEIRAVAPIGSGPAAVQVIVAVLTVAVPLDAVAEPGTSVVPVGIVSCAVAPVAAPVPSFNRLSVYVTVPPRLARAGLAVYSDPLRSATPRTTVAALSRVCGTLAPGFVSTALFRITAECSSGLIVTFRSTLAERPAPSDGSVHVTVRF